MRCRDGRFSREGARLISLDDVPCGILQTSTDGTIRRVNQTFCSWLGKRSEDLVEKKRLQDLLTMGGRIFHQTHWAPLLQMQGSISEVKLEVVHADGTAVPIVFNVKRNPERGLDEIAAFVARDRDRYEQELVRAGKRLAELVAQATRLEAAASDRALLAEQLVGIVSHDLRNPMSAIQMGTALLASSDLNRSQQLTLNRIKRSLDRANLLIADLLDFTSARLGHTLNVSFETIDLHRAVKDAVDELAFTYEGRSLRHESEGEGTCTADGNRLVQAVGNLVSNAFAYGNPVLPVTVRTTVDSSVCVIEVSNHGDVIPAETQGRIFAPMSRGDHHDKSSRSLGLGLFIVSEIARAHDGTASVTSDVEHGTTFRIEFPRRRISAGG